MNVQKTVTVSRLKQSPARVMEEAGQTGKPVGILKNNELQGFYVPQEAFELIVADPVEVRKAVDQVIDEYGDAITWLATR